MIYGMGATISFPIGSVGAARQAEAIINAVQPMSAAVGGFIPAGKGDNDLVPLTITVGTANYDASAVETQIASGDATAVMNLLNSSGYHLSTPVTVPATVAVRDLGPLVAAANIQQSAAGLPTAIVSTPTPIPAAPVSPITSSVASGVTSGNVVTQTSAVPVIPSTTNPTMSSILSGSTFGTSNTTLLIAAIAIAAILFMEKD